MEIFTIYTILLTDNKYYVGKTKLDPKERFNQHLTDKSAVWTSKYKPLEIIDTFESNDSFSEDKRTKEMMIKYGIENVRGGSYCSVQLPEWQVKSLEHEFESISDQCYKCKKKGHFSRDCEKYHKELEQKKYDEYLPVNTIMMIEQIEKINRFIKDINGLNLIVKKLKFSSEIIYLAINNYEKIGDPRKFLSTTDYQNNQIVYNYIFNMHTLFHRYPDSSRDFIQTNNLDTFRKQYNYLVYKDIKARYLAQEQNLFVEINTNFKLFNFKYTNKDNNYDVLSDKLNFFKDLCVCRLTDLFYKN